MGKGREFWLGCHSAFLSKDGAERHQAVYGGEVIHVREVVEDESPTQPTELEMHRADYQSVKAAGFECVGELLAAYKVLLSKTDHAAAPEEVLTRWLAKEMPSGTVIGRPEWWAPRIVHVLEKHLHDAGKEAIEFWQAEAVKHGAYADEEAQHAAALADALEGLMHGNVFKSFNGEPPEWHEKQIASSKNLTIAREALATYRAEPLADPGPCPNCARLGFVCGACEDKDADRSASQKGGNHG